MQLITTDQRTVSVMPPIRMQAIGGWRLTRAIFDMPAPIATVGGRIKKVVLQVTKQIAFPLSMKTRGFIQLDL
ncbi:hypothetical protein [Aeromonas veronii]|uniref:hypothetical protein n=1 Tax=Aeromonas veronii TaxID=654 RepID=UPI003BA38950